MDKKYLEAIAELELEPNFTLKELRKKWLELSKKYHPDKYQTEDKSTIKFAEEKIIKINEAYNYLKENFEENKIFFKQRYILYFIKSNIHFSEFFEDKILNLKNQLIYLEYQLNYFDEFYPQLNSYTDEQFNSFINKKFIYEKFDFIENSLNKYIINSDVFSLFIKLYYLKGRSLIRDGYNNEGQIYIDKLLLNSKKEDEKYKILGLFEKVYLGLRLQNLDIINKYLKKLTDTHFVAIKDEIMQNNGKGGK